MSIFMLMFALGSADAAPVAWQWSGEPAHYHVEALLKTQNPLRYLARKNLDARASEHELSMDLECGVAQPAKRGWSVDCALSNVRLQATAWPGEQDKLNEILVEWTQDLSGGTIQLGILSDGRINTVDLEGVSKSDDRETQIHETQRQLLRRVVMPLDLQVTGKEPVMSKAWKQKGHPLAFELISKYGTSGGSIYKHTVVDINGPVVRVQSEGRGNVATGANLDANTGAIVNLVVNGDGLFDTESGRLLYREVTVHGELNQTAMAAMDATYWSQKGWIGRINADGTIEGGASD